MKMLFRLLFVGGLWVSAWAVGPSFFGARMLALGYASASGNPDTNAVYLNPSVLAKLQFGLSSMQYQHGYYDYNDFRETLNGLLKTGFADFQTRSLADRTETVETLEGIFQSKVGIHGFQTINPGTVGRFYGTSVAFIKSAIITPLESDFFSKPVDQITTADFADLKLNVLGFSYTQYTVAGAIPIGKTFFFGTSIHFLTGKISDFDVSLLDPELKIKKSTYDYLEYGWNKKETDFSRANVDLGASAALGQYFSLGVSVRNLLNPKIETARRTLTIPRRVIAGIGFQSQDFWSVFLDIDVSKVDLYFNGKKSQPIHFGVQKGFFQNQFCLRAGMMNDLNEEDFLGKKSNVLYGLGLGFNVMTVQCDLALGLDRLGHIKSLAISGFFIMQGAN